MNNLANTIATYLFVVAFLFGATACSTTQTKSDPLSQTLEAIRLENEIVGFAAGIVEDGALVYSEGFGEISLGAGKAITGESIFHWASVSKPFVAIAIMQLYERGEIDLDGKLVDILPDYHSSDPRHKDITIKQILSHTAGIPDVEDYNWDQPEFDDHSLSRWVLQNSPRELLFAPGTDRKYSNLGYEILGLVIQRVSGMSFEGYMTRNIFAPLEMTHSTFYYPDTSPSLRTSGHHGGADQKSKIDHYPYNRRHGPSSTLNTNIEEIAKFAQALLQGGEYDGARILKAETINEMWAPYWKNNEDGSNANTLGWSRVIRNGQTIINHSGWDDGYRSALILLPETSQAILFVTNDETARPGRYVQAILQFISE